MKNSIWRLLRSKGGVLRSSSFPSFLKGRRPSKKHTRFLEGAAWNFSWLDPLGSRMVRTLLRGILSHDTLGVHLAKKPLSLTDGELFFPLEGLGSHWGGKHRKMGKNYKIPLPGPTPENGENCPQKRGKITPKIRLVIFM